MNPPNLPTVSLYTLTLREVIHREALIYIMPTVAAGGGHIFKNWFFLLQICQGSDGAKSGAQRQIPFWVGSDNEEEEEQGEQGEETIPKQVAEALADSVAEALADTQAELEAQNAIPSAGKESVDSAKLQSDGALNEVIKWDWRTRMLTWRGGWKSWRRNTNTQINNFEM